MYAILYTKVLRIFLACLPSAERNIFISYPYGLPYLSPAIICKQPSVPFFYFQHPIINPLKPELNPICYLLALLGAHHFLHVSRIRVKSLTLRRLMSYIYMEHPFLMFLDHTQRRSTVGRTPLDE